MIISRYIHVAANGIMPFFFMANIPLHICTMSFLSIPLPLDICFHVLATVSSAAINTEVHVSFQIMRGARLTGGNGFRLQFRCFPIAYESHDDG